jgi:hypothetical protein
MCVSTGGGFAFQLCDSMHGCPTGDQCIAAFGGRGGGGGMMGGGMICLNPEAGSPFGMMMDAGRSSDTGAPETGATDTGAVDTGADVGATDTGASDTGSSDASDGGTG